MSENQKYADKTIDVRGIHGTEVELRVKIEIDRQSTGQTLRILTDDPTSGEVISRLVSRMGHELVFTSPEEFLIQKA